MILRSFNFQTLKFLNTVLYYMINRYHFMAIYLNNLLYSFNIVNKVKDIQRNYHKKISHMHEIIKL
jgi:hypothetical protein